MTAEIVNLRRARKDKVRGEREKKAADNRLAYGRSKHEKASAKAERERAGKTIDGHRREPAKP
jgi:hypothetical protein